MQVNMWREPIPQARVQVPSTPLVLLRLTPVYRETTCGRQESVLNEFRAPDPSKF